MLCTIFKLLDQTLMLLDYYLTVIDTLQIEGDRGTLGVQAVSSRRSCEHVPETASALTLWASVSVDQYRHFWSMCGQSREL